MRHSPPPDWEGVARRVSLAFTGIPQYPRGIVWLTCAVCRQMSGAVPRSP